MTPAQASGHPNFVTDVPVQGPTDEGMRAADCWFAQNRLPAKPACVDCNNGSGLGEGLMETISYGGRSARGFALGGASDPAATLTDAQMTWVKAALVLLNNIIMKSSGTTCSTWVDPGLNLSAAVGCFQQWYNANKPAPAIAVRTDGVLDADTVNSLQFVATQHPTDFNAAFPAAGAASTTPATGTKPGLSTGEMVGIGIGGAALLGGVIYAATSGGKKGKRKR